MFKNIRFIFSLSFIIYLLNFFTTYYKDDFFNSLISFGKFYIILCIICVPFTIVMLLILTLPDEKLEKIKQNKLGNKIIKFFIE